MGRRNRHRRKSVTNLRYSDDTTLIAGTKEGLAEIMDIVSKTTKKAGLYLNF